jgi:hypothetical protein
MFDSDHSDHIVGFTCSQPGLIAPGRARHHA